MLVERNRLNILCLSGGGFRGLYSAAVLNKMAVGYEVENFRNCFDLIIGTSTGGLIASALACDVPTSRIVSAFIKHGRRIFPTGEYLKKAQRYLLTGAKYSNEPLIDAIDCLIPDQSDISIQDQDLDLALVAVSAITHTHRVFSGKRFSSEASDKVTLKEAILSTTAAPSFFIPQEVANDRLIDGGISANAPVLIGASMMEKFRQHNKIYKKGNKDLKPIHILHIGTATPPKEKKRKRLPSFFLGLRLAKYLSNLFMETQEAVTIDIANSWIEDRYLYVDAPANLCNGAELAALDNASLETERKLLLLAEHTWLQWKDNKTLERFFHHPRM